MVVEDDHALPAPAEGAEGEGAERRTRAEQAVEDVDEVGDGLQVVLQLHVVEVVEIQQHHLGAVLVQEGPDLLHARGHRGAVQAVHETQLVRGREVRHPQVQVAHTRPQLLQHGQALAPGPPVDDVQRHGADQRDAGEVLHGLVGVWAHAPLLVHFVGAGVVRACKQQGRGNYDDDDDDD